jgi:alkylhydroperoxidase family enzyme
MARESGSRVAPILPPAWDAAAHDALSVFPAARDFLLAGWQSGQAGIQGLNLMGTQLLHPALAKAALPLNAHVAKGITVSTRVRELLILRIAWLQRSEYEYVQHIRQGRLAGLTDAEIDRVQQGPDAPGWDPLDAELLRAVDELHKVACIQDATWARLAAHFDTRQLMDLVYIVGCYGVVSMFCNTCKVALEPGQTPLDPATRALMHAQNPRGAG